jgi:predicted AAA+ superfamily ATPase
MSDTISERKYQPRLVDSLLDDILRELPGVMVVGPRAAGKTTTIGRRAATTVALNAEAEAAAFRADPDAALRGLEEPVLLDEWQEVPSVFGAVRRAIDADPRPARYFLTGSVRAELDAEVWPGTGRLVRLPMYPMTVREQLGRLEGPTIFDRLASTQELAPAAEAPDIREYLHLALSSGFPLVALELSGRARELALESYLEQLLTHDVGQVEEQRTRPIDVTRLRRYFEAYALNSGGVLDHKTIYDAAQINRITATGYESLLTRLFVVEQVPAWSSNRLSRLTHQPKRYVIDAALVAAALRLDTEGIIRDGDLLGRVVDTFVAAQLRPEIELSSVRPRLFHVRTAQGRHEVDLLAELGGGGVIGVEVKAAAAPRRDDARHLVWLRDSLGDRFVAGVVFHTGPRVYELEQKIVAAPICTLWA